MASAAEIASALKGLGLKRDNGQNGRALLDAVSAGMVTTLGCAMPECVCPDGRGYFEPVGHRSPWAPSADRWPLARRNGGVYAVDNVRLAHRRCNTLDGTRVTQEHLRANGYYGSPKHREVGRQMGLGRREGMREWWKTPEGQAVREANAQRMRDRNPGIPDTTGSRLAEWRAEHPDAARSAGRRGNLTMAAAVKSRPGLLAACQERARRTSCKRWNIDRGKPCACGHHAGIA